MEKKAFRKCISPGVPLTLELEDSTGKFSQSFKLAYDFNSLAAVQMKIGINMLTMAAWSKIDDPSVLHAMFWGAVLAHQPEFNCDEGYEVLGSYINNEERTSKVIEGVWAAYRAYLSEEKRKLLPESLLKAAQKEPSANPTMPVTPAQLSTGLTSGPSPATTSSSQMPSSAA